MRARLPRRVAALASAALLVTAAACTGDEPDPPGPDQAHTLVFGLPSEPPVLDGALLSDPEALRVVGQVFEGLVRTESGSTEVEPALASSWDVSPDGTAYTFSVRDDVTFHDGTSLDAAAVCYNFDRWYHFTGVLQSPDVSASWQDVFGGFAEDAEDSADAPETGDSGEAGSPAPSLYVSCEERDESTAVVTLSSPSGTFLSALSLPSFSLASPTALKRYDADAVAGSPDAPRFTGTFGTQHPVGTGPFAFRSWDRGDRLVLERYEDYWGDTAVLDRLVFRLLPEDAARAQALRSGDVDGYDRVERSEASALSADGYQVVRRPPLSVGYLAFNTATPPLDEPRVRQAIAHAVDREALVESAYPPSARVAREFVPPPLWGYEPEVPAYDHDPATARRLLSESGVAEPSIALWYPPVADPLSQPDPQAVAERVADDLEAVGFTVELRTAPTLARYRETVERGDAPLHLDTRTSTVPDPHEFLGVLFGGDDAAWGRLDAGLTASLQAAAAEPDQERRKESYAELNVRVMELLPGLPYVYPTSSVALAPDVDGFVPSPGGTERFADVSVDD
ncbi:MAG: ABC transporter substrate-binding protein [Actinomycetes bacterium]